MGESIWALGLHQAPRTLGISKGLSLLSKTQGQVASWQSLPCPLAWAHAPGCRTCWQPVMLELLEASNFPATSPDLGSGSNTMLKQSNFKLTPVSAIDIQENARHACRTTLHCREPL